MTTPRMFSTLLVLLALTCPLFVNGEMNEQAASDQALNVVRSELRSTVHFKSDEFLGISRDEDLEQSLAVAAVGWRSGPVFIYELSPTGIEIRKNRVIAHVATDADFLYIVAVRAIDGSTYRIHGFGLAESMTEFERLMTGLRMRIVSPDQAESLANFYRKVNPGNQENLIPISSLLGLKQAAERQCHSGEKSFDAGQNAFIVWWNRSKPLDVRLQFEQRAVPHGDGYRVEWITLSSPSGENCGGAPLRATLQVGSDGHVGRILFSSVQEHPTSTAMIR